MRKLSIGIASAMLALAIGLPANAVAPVTVTGELIDVMCGVDKKGDATHKACAESCAKRGEPVAVFAKDGMFVITGKLTESNNAKLLEFMTKNVTVTGEVTKDKDGKLSIAAESIALAK
jgi:hypothetical protein